MLEVKRTWPWDRPCAESLEGSRGKKERNTAAGSEWVTGDESKLALIILHGVTGPIEVAGETFNGMMPPWGGTMKDADIAAVITYVRGAWGNKATPVTAAKIASIRAAHTSRTTPWTAAELAAVK